MTRGGEDPQIPPPPSPAPPTHSNNRRVVVGDRKQAEGDLRFQVKLFVLFWDLASHWVSECVASSIVAVEEKRRESAAISCGGQSHKPKVGRP